MRVANAPYSWGVVQGVEGQEALTWRQVLDEIARSGYTGTELGDWAFMPNDPVLLRRELAARSLAMAGAFTPVRLSDPAAHAEGEATALRTARLLAECARGTADEGTPFIILADDPGPASHRTEHAGRIRPEHGLSESGWRAVAEGTERVATAVREQTGLRTVFHHHCGTFIETPEETARLMEMTPADLVGLCLDTGHYAYGGGDPLEALRDFRERVWHVHFKDCDATVAENARATGWDYPTSLRNGIFCGLGQGYVDHAAFFGELERSGYDGWIVVENEAPPGRVPPLIAAQRDREYLAGLGL
ncbi:MAG TPA: TIM barrel protein [Dehalococcoidia bacterium]|jgi:inosose dehydratase